MAVLWSVSGHPAALQKRFESGFDNVRYYIEIYAKSTVRRCIIRESTVDPKAQ